MSQTEKKEKRELTKEEVKWREAVTKFYDEIGDDRLSVCKTVNTKTGENEVSICGSFTCSYREYVGIPKGGSNEPVFLEHEIMNTLILSKSHKDGDIAALEECTIEVQKLYPDEIETFAKNKASVMTAMSEHFAQRDLEEYLEEKKSGKKPKLVGKVFDFLLKKEEEDGKKKQEKKSEP
jgi:hypothetical protein